MEGLVREVAEPITACHSLIAGNFDGVLTNSLRRARLSYTQEA
jgi:hypothetical protein